MNAFKEYHNLSVNVRAARRALIAAEQKITAYNDEYRLGALPRTFAQCAP